MKITLGFSPCPNDTFIFDALVNKKIDTGEFDFEVILEDVQTLNQWALDGQLDLTKISYGVLPLVTDKYIMLHSGGALGKGVGPLLITANRMPVKDIFSEINNFTIAIPGEHTTAHLLFTLAFPGATHKVFRIFNEIEDLLVVSGEESKTAGVIIHENRFTYQEKGLSKLMDLGEYWEQTTGFPIPLGGIAIKRNFDEKVRQQINALIRKSLHYARSHYPQLSDYVKVHAQEMDEQVMRKHIDLYVNDFSDDLGEGGRNAVFTFLNIYAQNKNKVRENLPVFIDEHVISK